MKSFLLACVLALGLAGCVSTANLTSAQSLFNIQTRYTELGAVVIAYVALPLCEDVELYERCADLNVVRTLQHAEQTFYLALVIAEAARDTIDAERYRVLAVAALAQLRGAIIKYSIRKVLK